jgi:nucleotide-binding universal stress UspA family protein
MARRLLHLAAEAVMSTTPRKIVVGIDLSAYSEVAAGHALELARAEGGELEFVLVDLVPEMPEPSIPPSAMHAAHAYAERLGERLAKDKADLAKLVAAWSGRGVPIASRVVDGFPDEVLPQVARDLDASAIVVGSHGRTGLKRLLIGSVAERTVRLAECAVMVARGAAPIGGYHRLVVGVDFGETSARALDRALGIAAKNAHVDLVHCWQMSPLVAPPDAPAMIPTYDRIRVDTIGQLQQEGDSLASRARSARPDVKVVFQLLERPAAHALDDFAREHHADLLVVGSHGRRGVRRFLLGSIAEVAVRHAPCTTLVVH